jgi:hypothetical protein
MKKNGRNELNNDSCTSVRSTTSSSSIDNDNSYKTNESINDINNSKIDINTEKVSTETKIKKIEELIVDVPALNGVDNRVKMGIPFLIPIIKKDYVENDIEGEDLINVIIRLDYTYLG